MQSLSGKTVLVTGASSGIGRATAKAFAREGMRVALSARSVDKLQALATELGGDAVVVPADLTVLAEVDGMIADGIGQLGVIDVLFANAGIYIPGQVVEGDPDAWDRMLMLNVNSVFRAIRAVLPHMQARNSGDILVTSSISAHQELHFEPVYSASKHAVNTFVHGLRRQVLPHNIRVGSLAPGTVLNELWGYHDPAEIDRQVAARAGLRSEDCGRCGSVHAHPPSQRYDPGPRPAPASTGHLGTRLSKGTGPIRNFGTARGSCADFRIWPEAKWPVWPMSLSTTSRK